MDPGQRASDEDHDAGGCDVLQELPDKAETLCSDSQLIPYISTSFLRLDGEYDALSEHRQIRPPTEGKEGLQEDAPERERGWRTVVSPQS